MKVDFTNREVQADDIAHIGYFLICRTIISGPKLVKRLLGTGNKDVGYSGDPILMRLFGTITTMIKPNLYVGFLILKPKLTVPYQE